MIRINEVAWEHVLRLGVQQPCFALQIPATTMPSILRIQWYTSGHSRVWTIEVEEVAVCRVQ